MQDKFAIAVLAEPALVAWLKSGLWRRGFDRGSLTRAADYTSRSQIKLLEVDSIPSSSVTCKSWIKGSRPQLYSTDVGFFSIGKVWAVRCECSCPVGIYCKHSAAVILLLLENLTPAVEIFSSASAPLPTKLEPWLHAWLEQVKNVTVPVPVTSPAKRPAEEKRFLAYCLYQVTSYQSKPTWRFGLRVGSRLKGGKFSISDTPAQADPSKPPKYMVTEDFIPASLYYQRKRRRDVWDQMPFESDDWEKLLETALDTGRFYFLEKEPGTWLAAQAGPEVSVRAAWGLLPDGSAQPRLDFVDGTDRLILPTIPLRYLERESGNIGLLISDLPATTLIAWFNGSAIPARQIQPIIEKLQQLAPSLPVPQQVETLELPAVRPFPHLIIRKKTFGSSYYSRTYIYGCVHFRYAGGKPLRPLALNESPIHYEIWDGIRRVQPRDAKAEAAEEKRLHRLGFIPLQRLLGSTQTDAESRRALLPPDHEGTGSDAWFTFLASTALTELKQDRWTVEIEPDTGLLIHDAGDFFSDIQADPDHGIEWFRFDAQFEIGGKKLSLIPYIAEAIRRDLPPVGSPGFPEFLVFPGENPEDGSIRFPAAPLMEMVAQVRHLFQGHHGDGPVKIDRLGAASIAHALAIDSSETLRSLAKLAQNLLNIRSIPTVPIPKKVTATLRDYQAEGFHWLQFLAENSLHGILADDMGLGKTIQTLTHLAAETVKKPGKPSLVLAPTSVVSNWAAEAEKFTTHLKVVLLHGKDRGDSFRAIPKADLVITSYPLLTRDFEILSKQDWHLCVLDEAQYIKNSKAIIAKNVCQLRASHRLCLSGTPMENHLGELWSLMRFLMPGFLGDETAFNNHFRRPIERDRSRTAQLSLNRRISPLILRRTKDQVATELPPKTEIIHAIDLTKKQTDLYESVRAAMDKRVRDAISDKGLAKSHIIVLDALLKLRQICCHPQLLKNPAAQKVTDSAKLDYLTDELLPTLLEEGRRILLFSSFTSMLALIEAHLEKQKIPFLILTGQTQDRASLVKKFQSGEAPIFLISLKAGGTGLNLTAADTVIHYDPWWNPAAENQATDRVHRIGQTKPVFVHKLVCTGTIEERILDLQKHKSALIEALLSEETSKLKIDSETLSHLLAPLD